MANSHIFTPSDIKWLKNINNPVEFAYKDVGDEFTLHVPNHHGKNALSPEVNDIILLFQKVNGITCFTHLVTPIDNKKITETNTDKYKYGRRVKVLAQVKKGIEIPKHSTIWNGVSFSGISGGNHCTIDSMRNIINADVLREESWNLFEPNFYKSMEISHLVYKSIQNTLEQEENDLSAPEGGLRLRTHMARERDQKIVRAKKNQAILDGNLNCEVCTFSFLDEFGHEFMECHHKTPISQGGERETHLDDLALVCPNCHRMLHRKFDGEFLSIEDFKERFYPATYEKA